MNFKVVILSARADNLIACVQALFEHEPALPRQQIIVVDDGARAGAEAELPGITWVTGEKPFIFARNANRGIEAANSDVVLLHDDALLLSPAGLSGLSRQVAQNPAVGLASAAIQGVVGNSRQRVDGSGRFRLEGDMLAFISVCITRALFERLGPLDERFTGYGRVDRDYSIRARLAGFTLGIWHGCIVEHSHASTSTFRARDNFQALFDRNKQLYQEKWQRRPLAAQPSVDLLYLAWNRLAFTQESFTTLLGNTEWGLVRRLFLFDDGSEDGTRPWLESQVDQIPTQVSVVRSHFNSPVAAMDHFIKLAKAPVLGKVDNDAMMPPGWLSQSLKVMDRHPELYLLGLEAMNPHDNNPQVERTYEPSTFIGGLGLFRRAAFAGSLPTPWGTYFGFTEWQSAHGPELARGWIRPALPVFLLDRLPYEPWASLSQKYVELGWQRPWQMYDPADSLWHWRWPELVPERS